MITAQQPPAMFIQALALGLGVAGYLQGWWVIASRVLSILRRHRGPDVEPA